MAKAVDVDYLPTRRAGWRRREIAGLKAISRWKARMKIDFYAFQAEAEQRRCDLAQAEESSDEMLRNKGGGQTPAKRQLLSRIERRATAAGRPATRAFY